MYIYRRYIYILDNAKKKEFNYSTAEGETQASWTVFQTDIKKRDKGFCRAGTPTKRNDFFVEVPSIAVFCTDSKNLSIMQELQMATSSAYFVEIATNSAVSLGVWSITQVVIQIGIIIAFFVGFWIGSMPFRY